MLRELLLVGVGGAVGSIARYATQKWFVKYYPHGFPIGTFVINITGCFIIGLLFGLSTKHEYLSPALRLLLMAGFCGGFTTFSAFTLEGMELLQQQKYFIFVLYVGLSVFLGLTATFAGAALGR